MHFLVWAPHSARAENLSQQLGACLNMLSYKTKVKIYAPIKYPLLFCKTLFLLASNKPKDAIIICQSPPIFCPLTVILYAMINRKKKNIRIVIDAHTATFEKPWSFPILNALTRWTIKNSLAIIVTNTKLQKAIYHKYGVLPIVLEDGPRVEAKIVNPRSSIKRNSVSNVHHQSQQYPLKHILSTRRHLGSINDSPGKNFAIAVVSSYAGDEPLQEIIEAASILADTTTFYITGDNSQISTRQLQEWKRSANNIILTGFLNYAEYINLLERVDAVLVLTKRDCTMLSGAYEALALEKPLITSDWQPLREYFAKGTAYVNNSVNEIVHAIKYVQVEKDRMKKEMQLLKHQRLKEWEYKVSELREFFFRQEVQ
jgi:glycosyltransferase involved in cell wall biosynthesis